MTKNQYLFFFVINFLVFGYDIQNDRDFWTWIWLLTSIIYGFKYLSALISEQIFNKLNEH